MNGSRGRSRLVAGLVTLMLSLSGKAHAAPVAVAADEAAIRAQGIDWEKAYNAGDAKAVTALYAEDAFLLPPGAPRVRGRAAIQAFFAKDIAESKAAGAVFVLDRKTDVGVSGNMGWESGTYTATVKGAAVESGKFLSVFQKKNGKWIYICDSWNADAPPAPAAPAQAATAPSAPAAKPEAKK